jgi:hypothetical protein
LKILTPGGLPEAIAGRPYNVALAADGGLGPLHWSLDGALPEGLSFDPEKGLLKGTPSKGTPQPVELAVRVSDGEKIDAGLLKLVVYQSDAPLSTPAWWKPGIPPVPWRAWLDHGVGFLIVWLVHLVGMSTLANFEARAESGGGGVAIEGAEGALATAPRRFAVYRALVRLSSLSAAFSLVVWIWSSRPH